MKKSFLSMLVAILVLVTLTVTALAASYAGSIWTGKPTVLGTGYYCTAARNDSGGDTSTHWAWARTYYSGGSAYQRKTGNVRAVASTGSEHPSSGEGQYGETGWSSNIGKFSSGAWD